MANKVCKQCGGELPAGRTGWCCAECYRNWCLNLRQVCRLCGLVFREKRQTNFCPSCKKERARDKNYAPAPVDRYGSKLEDYENYVIDCEATGRRPLSYGQWMARK